MSDNRFDKRLYIYMLAAALWLAVWQIASTLTGLDIVLPGPVKVFFCMTDMLAHKSTYIITLNSMLNILMGFATAFVTSVAAGIAAGCSRTVRIILAPPVSTMQALPVTAFIILVLMIAGAGRVSAVIAFIVVFPVIYHGMVQGIENMDRKLAEMADVFNIRGVRRFVYISLAQCMPYIKTAIKSSAGMCWKAGAAAEVIGLTRNSIGEQMYLSKLYLDTETLLSWGIIIILASVLFERVLLCAADMVMKMCCNGFRMRSVPHVKGDFAPRKIILENISAGYGKENVLSNINLEVQPGEHVCLMGESGIGKTTLLKIIAGLQEYSSGYANLPERISFVFQDDRLCPWLSACDNVRLAVPYIPKKVVRRELAKLIGEAACDKKADALSGGMKRRCEIVRAMLSDADTVIMDEPFAGLDEDNKSLAVRYILDNIGDRQLIVSTHDSKDAAGLHAEAFFIDKNGNG